MEVWLFFVVLGLVLDIAGIWLIAKPLLNKVYRNKVAWERRKKLADLKFKLEALMEKQGTGEKATNKDLFNLYKYVYERFDQEMSHKENQKSLAYVGLFIITLGFIFQMVGYYTQSLQ